MTVHSRILRPGRFALVMSAIAVAAIASSAGSAAAADYIPNQIVVGTIPGPYAPTAQNVERRMGARIARTTQPDDATATVLTLPTGTSVTGAIAQLKNRPGVAYAVPNYIAHMAGSRGWIPNDPGRGTRKGGWRRLQWNFLSRTGIDMPRAWRNLREDGRPGGKGVVVAVLDTGVAYRDWRQFTKAPDFARTRFVDPHDFVAHNRFPLDREGHGTFVTSILAESTNNGFGLTGVAYGASVMPVRVLDAIGSGDAATIARGIRYAVNHHAQVINLSLEFTPNVTAGDIPDIISAIQYATRRGVVVVAASGNDYGAEIAYPARAPSVISVGATTRDGCLATYSNGGPGLTLVAPGGGADKAIAGDGHCHPGRLLPPIYAMTFANPQRPSDFSIPGNMFGTSMSTPHVAGTAALVIASRVIGRHPSPEAVRDRLEITSRPLSATRPTAEFGYGIIDAGLATGRKGQR